MDDGPTKNTEKALGVVAVGMKGGGGGGEIPTAVGASGNPVVGIVKAERNDSRQWE